MNRARRLVATLLNSPQTDRIVFTHNGTDSLNFVLHGLLQLRRVLLERFRMSGTLPTEEVLRCSVVNR